MSRDEFLDRLDAAILSGSSLSRLVREFPIHPTTIRRRKAALRAAGHTIPSAQGYDPRALRQEREVDNATNQS